MEIKENQLQRFIQIYQEECGVTLSRAEAQDSAYNLVRLVTTLLLIEHGIDFFE